MGVVLRAHPIRGESHTQRNANGEVATIVRINAVSSFVKLSNQKIYRCTTQTTHRNSATYINDDELC